MSAQIKEKLTREEFIAKFIRARKRALLSLDEEKIKRFMKKYNIPVPEEKDAFWGGVYKTIVNMDEASDEMKKDARKQLKKLKMDESFDPAAGLRSVK